jgi:transposase
MDTVTISREEYEELRALRPQVGELAQQLQWLKEQVRLAKYRQFGPSSEKSEYGQLNLFNEVEQSADEHADEPALCEVEKHYRQKAKRGADRLPPELPVEVVEHVLPAKEQVCPECGGQLHILGKEVVREELKLIPAKAVKVQHVRYAYACRRCEKDGDSVPVLKAPVPPPVIKGSFASPEAIAHIAVQKYVMCVPLYRQEQAWKRVGILLSRQTMSNWLLRATRDWLEPVYNALHRLLLERSVLHADESVLQVLHEDGKSAQSQSRMWLYRTSGDAKLAIVLFEYQPDRSAKRARAFLDGFKGYLHTDGYEGYHSLPEDIVVVGCWAHARRKFDEALKAVPKAEQVGSGAVHGQQVCDKLFAIERDLVELEPEERLKKRRKLAKPILDEFYQWLDCQDTGKTAFCSAVKYTLGQWKYLERYLLDGRLEISNNRAENSIRPFAVGRKNWLFCNTPKGARASAILYSIVETAKANDLDPYGYLAHIFATAPRLDLDDPEAVSSLLPDRVPELCRTTGTQTTMSDCD